MPVTASYTIGSGGGGGVGGGGGSDAWWRWNVYTVGGVLTAAGCTRTSYVVGGPHGGLSAYCLDVAWFATRSPFT